MVLLFNVYSNDSVLCDIFEKELYRYGDTKMVSKDLLFETSFSMLLAFGGNNVVKLIDDLHEKVKECSIEREKETAKISYLKFNAFKISECYGDFNDEELEWLSGYLNNNC